MSPRPAPPSPSASPSPPPHAATSRRAAEAVAARRPRRARGWRFIVRSPSARVRRRAPCYALTRYRRVTGAGADRRGEGRTAPAARAYDRAVRVEEEAGRELDRDDRHGGVG